MRFLRALPARLVGLLRAKDSPGPLAIFRVGLAGVALVRLAALWPSLIDVFGQYGFVQWAITRSNLDSYLPHIGNVALLLKPLGVTADQTVFSFAILDVVVLLLLAAGWHTRVCAIAAFVLDILFIHAAGGLLYGADIFIHIAFFYLVFMPSGDAFSLGDAIWRSVALPAFRAPAYFTIDLSALATVPWLPLVSGWVVILTETGYGVFIWGKRTRLVWLCLTLGMHLFIGLGLGMPSSRRS
jgi:hypothetical protein